MSKADQLAELDKLQREAALMMELLANPLVKNLARAWLERLFKLLAGVIDGSPRG